MDDAEFSEVLAAARANGEWAWERLYRAYAPDVLQFLRAQRAAQPEDVLGDVFVDVVRSLHTFEGSAAGFRAWLFRLANNRLIDEHRRRTRRHEQAMGDVPEADRAESSAETIVITNAQEARLYAVLEVLPPDQRAAMLLRHVMDLQPAEIATAIGRTPGAVKMLLHRGGETLRERLGPEFPDRP